MDKTAAAPPSPGTGADEASARRLVREQVSAAMDGESSGDDGLQPAARRCADARELARLAGDPDARAAWLEYHQIGDWLRSAELHAARDERAFLRDLGRRLRCEPAAFGPRRGIGPMRRFGWRRAAPWTAALAAALAGVATLALTDGALPGAGRGPQGVRAGGAGTVLAAAPPRAGAAAQAALLDRPSGPVADAAPAPPQAGPLRRWRSPYLELASLRMPSGPRLCLAGWRDPRRDPPGDPSRDEGWPNKNYVYEGSAAK